MAFLVLGCALVMRSDPRELVPGAWNTSAPMLLAKAAVYACVRPQGVLSEKEWKVESEAEGKRGEPKNVRMPEEKLQALSVSQAKWR